MTYPSHGLLSFGGGLGTSQEEWSCGLRIVLQRNGDPAPIQKADQEAYVDVAVPALEAWFGNQFTGIDGGATLRWVKFNAINGEGHYVHPDTTERYGLNTIGGLNQTAAGLRYPLQVSTVHTLETDVGRGYASKGRIYVPAPGMGLETNGLFNPNNVETAAQQTADLIGALNTGADPEGSFSVAVVSKLGNGGAGTYNFVTRVSVDTRPDIQRSRAGQMQGIQRRTVAVD